MKQQILSLQKKIFKQLKLKSQSISGEMSTQFKSYEKEYLSSVNNQSFNETHNQFIINTIKKKPYTFISDFHTFDQNQKNFIRIIRELRKQNFNFIIGIEIIHSKYQNFINAFLDGYITESELLESVNYYEYWPFPWIHYKEIFQLAKDSSIPIIALNSIGDLTSRDRHAASIIKEYALSNNAPIITLFGELHISNNHLPSYFNKNEICIVHQHLDYIYWSLQERALKNTIVSFSSYEFCIVTSPPWLKYQSMINWYETLSDEPDSDHRKYIIRTGLKNIKSTANDLFQNLITDAYEFFNVKEKLDNIDNFEIHDYNKFDYLYMRIKELRTIKNQNFYEQLLSTNHSFKLWNSNDYYCSEYTNKKMTSLVGIHLFYCILESLTIDYKRLILKGSSRQRFSLFFFQYFWAYLSSKVFNPHTKCDLYRDLYLKNKKYSLTKTEKRITSTALEIMEVENDDQWPFSEKARNFKLYQVAKILGEFYCEFYYSKIINCPEDFQSLKDSYLKKEPSYELYLKLKSQIFPNKSYKLSKKRIF